jgi:hypothetical protein
MKRIFFATGVALCVYSSGIAPSFHDESRPTDEAAAIRCSNVTFETSDQCEDRYRRDFASGALDPMALLRQHCTRWKSPWDRSLDEPPATCIEQFGGWIES